jgi:hypothetical protein
MFKKPTVFSDESGSQVLGKDGSIKASFSVADHGASHEGAAVSHLQQNFDSYMGEDVEQVDEISSDMAYRYLKGKRERDYDISPDGTSSKLKKPQSFGKMNRDMKSTARALRTIEKAKKTNEEVEISEENHYTVVKGKQGWSVNQHTPNGVWHHSQQTGYHDSKSKAVSWAKNHAGNREHKIDVKEEVESIDEVSKETMGRYINKAKDSIDTASYRQGHKEAHGSSSKELEKKLTKRHKGIETAVKKLTKEAKDSREYDYEGEMVHNQLQQMLHHITELKDMVKPNTNLPEWVQSKITLACDYIQTASDYLSGEMKEENGMPFKGPYRKVGERKDEYGNTVKNVAKHLAKKAMDKQKNEEAELEEKRGLWDNIHAKRKRIEKGSGERMRKPGSEGAPTAAALKASQTEAVDNPYAVGMAAAMKSTGDTPPLEKSTITKAHKIAKKVMKENKFLTGVLSKLEEGRGRPAKEGSAAWHRQQAAASAGKPKEEPVALGMQLRKAKSINAHVEFDDGKKHEIHPRHIEAFNDHMAHHRTSQDKAAFQKKASASHDAFVKAVTAPLPAKKDSGDYGMPKYGR